MALYDIRPAALYEQTDLVQPIIEMQKMIASKSERSPDDVSTYEVLKTVADWVLEQEAAGVNTPQVVNAKQFVSDVMCYERDGNLARIVDGPAGDNPLIALGALDAPNSKDLTRLALQRRLIDYTSSYQLLIGKAAIRWGSLSSVAPLTDILPSLPEETRQPLAELLEERLKRDNLSESFLKILKRHTKTTRSNAAAFLGLSVDFSGFNFPEPRKGYHFERAQYDFH